MAPNGLLIFGRVFQRFGTGNSALKQGRNHHWLVGHDGHFRALGVDPFVAARFGAALMVAS